LSNLTLALDRLGDVADVNQAANFVVEENIENLDLDYWNFSSGAIVIKQVAVRRINIEVTNCAVLMLIVGIFGGTREWKM